MDVIPLDGARVRGSHGRLPGRDADAPVLLCSDAAYKRDRLAAADVFGLVLELMR